MTRLRAPLTTFLLSASLLAQKTPQPIPAGFDFPADQAALLKLRDQNDTAGMRRHAFMVFAGMTQPTATGEAVWETWYSANETFGGAQPQALSTRKLQRRFRAPRQFTLPGAHPQAVGASLASFTLFNDSLRKFVRENQLYLKSTLKKVNNGFPSSTPVAQREIKQFKNDAVAVKTVWWIVKKNGMTALPVWDAAANPPLPGGNDFGTWKRCVAIDPSRTTIPAAETTSMSCNQGPKTNTRVVPLNSFYHFTLTQDDVTALKQIPSMIPNIDDAAVGNYLVLVAMHCTTKEIPDWVWATFWWHDKPDDGPFAANRPTQVTGPWRNYLMDTSYSMDTPKASDGKAHAAFNPWLEARFPDGTVSNCMTCHRRAIFSGKDSDISFFPITRGTPPTGDPRFQGATKLDFLWSVLLESQ
jgi:hypothetical protein